MLFDRKRLGPAILDRITQAMQRAHAGVAAPRKDEPVCDSHADQLIVDEVGSHPDEGQVLASLADDLVAGGEGNQMREALHCDRVAILYVPCDRLLERTEGGHSGLAPS